MGWKDTEAEGEGKYIKFKPGMQVTCKILDYPVARNFEGDDGKEVESYDLPVLVNGEEKIIGLSSKRLRRALAAMDDMRAMVGTWCSIKATGEGFQRQYQVVPLLAAPEGQEDEDEAGIDAMADRIAEEQATKETAESHDAQKIADQIEAEAVAAEEARVPDAATAKRAAASKLSAETQEKADRAAALKRAEAARKARGRRARIKAEKEAEEAEDE